MTLPEKIMMLGFLLLAGIALLKCLMQPLTNFDTLNYHIPAMIQWSGGGSVLNMTGLGIGTYYPYNWEALCLNFLLPFRSDCLAVMPVFLSWVLSGLAVFAVSRRLGIERLYALASSLLFLSIPLLLDTVATVHIDLPLAAFFMAGVLCVLSYYQGGSLNYLYIFLPVLGMMAGIKTSGIPLCFILALIFTALIIFKALKKENPGGTGLNVPLLAGSFLIMVLLGAFWYCRNWAVSGNPLGFLDVNLFGREIFRGSQTSAFFYHKTLAYTFNIKDLSDWKLLFSQVILRLQAPIAVLGFFALISLKGLFGRQEKRAYIISLLLLLIVLLWLYVNTPFTSDMEPGKKMTTWIGFAFRYAFMDMALLALLAGAGMSLIRLPAGLCAALALAGILNGIAGVLFLDNIKEIFGLNRSDLLGMFRARDPHFFVIMKTYMKILLPYALLSILIIAGWTVFILKTALNFKNSFVKWGAAALIFITAFMALEIRYKLTGVVYGQSAAWIQDNLSVGKNRIGYVNLDLPYTLYGRNLMNETVPLEGYLKPFTNSVEGLKLNFVAVGYSGHDKLEAAEWLENTNGEFKRITGEDPRKISEFEKMQYTDYRIKAFYMRKVLINE
jgi:hypothetical protein